MNTKALLLAGILLLLVGLVFRCLNRREGFDGGDQKGVIVFKLKKANGRYLSFCYNCFGTGKVYLCERGVGVNFVKIPSPSGGSNFYLGVESPSGSLEYLDYDDNGLLCLRGESGALFGASFNKDHTVSIYVLTNDSMSGKYIQKCDWLDAGGMISPRETSVGCTSNMICLGKKFVCDENKYIVEMNNGIVYN